MKYRILVAAFLSLCACSSQASENGGDDASFDGITAGDAADDSASGDTIVVENEAASDSVGQPDAPSSDAPTDSWTGKTCVPATSKDSPPTPGHCEGTTAVTCSFDGKEVAQTCKSSESCATYAVQNESGAFTLQWAACLPKGASACTLKIGKDSLGGPRWLPEKPDACDGDTMVVCKVPPTPAYFTPLGSKTGYLLKTPCPGGGFCTTENNSEHAPSCLPKGTPPCTGAEGYCVGDVALSCFGEKYPIPDDCASRKVSCLPGCPGKSAAHCGGTGSVACDPSTFARVCGTVGSSPAVMTCSESTCDTSWDVCDLGKCGMANFRELGKIQLGCLDASKPSCDPTKDIDSCAGDVAHRCLGVWDDTDCTKIGEVCRVSKGYAGCMASTAKTCTSGATVCVGDTVSGCCPASGTFFGQACVPGYEAALDCSAVMFMGAKLICKSVPPPGMSICAPPPPK